MANRRIGIREMKNEASAVIRLVRAGSIVTITDRGEPVAVLLPLQSKGADGAARLRALAEAGRISWSGGKPRGLADGPTVRGPTVADAILEDRR